MALQKVCIFGLGNVGSKVVEQIVTEDGPDRGHENPTQIVGLITSKRMKLSVGGILEPSRFLDRATMESEGDAHSGLSDVLRAIEQSELAHDVMFVDATADASSTMLEVHKKVLQMRSRMVTANKNPLARFSFNDFRELTRRPNVYRYNASVMAGGDAVPFLLDSQLISEPVFSIEGCFSGTLGFVASALEEGRPFSEVVRDAHAKRYTEPHPWDDLSGIDVARKLLILVRSAGFPLEFSQIHIESFIPAEYGKIPDVSEFLQALSRENENLKHRMDAARDQGKTLRYVASFQNLPDKGMAMDVGLREVDISDPLGQLRGTSNLVKIITRDRAPAETPHVITSKGAGVVKTAAAIRADLAKFIQDIRLG